MARAKTIVLADADHESAKSVELLLENEGYRVLVAHDGDEALARARDSHPDLVVLEILLPQKNGYQVCRALKADAATASIGVVFLTAKAQPSDRFWAKRVGADAFVAKPFDPADLVREVHAVLQRTPKSRTPARS
jgi:twitching motility two-component system response regulator PilH